MPLLCDGVPPKMHFLFVAAPLLLLSWTPFGQTPEKAPSFEVASVKPASAPIDTKDEYSAGFNAGIGKDIVAVQVTYNHKFFTLMVGSYLGGSTNSAFLMSTVVFQNEPF